MISPSVKRLVYKVICNKDNYNNIKFNFWDRDCEFMHLGTCMLQVIEWSLRYAMAMAMRTAKKQQVQIGFRLFNWRNKLNSDNKTHLFQGGFFLEHTHLSYLQISLPIKIWSLYVTHPHWFTVKWGRYYQINVIN